MVLRHFCSLLRFMQLSGEECKLVFYSEGKNYWPYLQGLVREVLAISETSVCYVSSDPEDPGLFLENSKYKTFLIDEGFIRNWFFENLKATVLVTSMPDLNQFQVRRSKNKVHYIYVQHSLVSLHMVYRKGAFDFYDTIFCSGPHHVAEVRAIEKVYGVPKKNVFEHGYGRVDSLLSDSQKRPASSGSQGFVQHVLFAPSWGRMGAVETGVAGKVLSLLLGAGFFVTLRPHPQTLKTSKNAVSNIFEKFKSNDFFRFEDNVVGEDSLHESDVMISDWSGAALDYAFGLGKPVIFLDLPRKVNNQEYMKVGLEPLEVSIRESVGVVLDLEHMDSIVDTLKSIEVSATQGHVFNVGHSAEIGAKELLRICDEK